MGGMKFDIRWEILVKGGNFAKGGKKKGEAWIYNFKNESLDIVFIVK